jgi:hypothetical protein
MVPSSLGCSRGSVDGNGDLDLIVSSNMQHPISAGSHHLSLSSSRFAPHWLRLLFVMLTQSLSRHLSLFDHPFINLQFQS